jgi:hypothetical protein
MKRASLGLSAFIRKERSAYLDASLILSKGRCILLMLVSVYPCPSLRMRIYMRMHLPLLDRRCLFKGSSLICVSYLNFLHSN